MRSQRRTIDETQARPSFEAAGIAAIELCNDIDVSIKALGRDTGGEDTDDEEEDVEEASQLSKIIVTSRVAHRSRLIESTIEVVVVDDDDDDDDILILSDGSLFSD